MKVRAVSWVANYILCCWSSQFLPMASQGTIWTHVTSWVVWLWTGKLIPLCPNFPIITEGTRLFLRTFHLWYSTFYFSSFFPQISFTYHKIRHFKLWSPMVFSIFTGFYNHHHSHIPECLYHPKKTPHYSLSPLPHIPKPLTYSLFGFAFSRHFIFI